MLLGEVLVVCVLFCLFYWLLYASDPVEKKFIPPPPPPPPPPLDDDTVPPPPTFHFKIETTPNNNVTISTTTTSQNSSDTQQWTFQLDSKYMVSSDPSIRERDGCFGKPDGFKIKATGEQLYDYVHHRRGGTLNIEETTTTTTTRNGLRRPGQDFLQTDLQLFYFQCHNNQIQEVYACPPGKIFSQTECFPVNMCTDKPDGTVFPDSTDRHFYFECVDENPVRKQCPSSDTFFWIDACRPLTTLNADDCRQLGPVFPLTQKKYVRCLDGDEEDEQSKTSVVETCPDGTGILSSWDRCYPDDCIGKPDGFKTPMPRVFQNDGSFQYHPGYFLCRDQKIVETVRCPSEWDPRSSKGEEDLTQLPMVFDPKTFQCTLPSLCDTVHVSSGDVIVPVHEFTKYLLSWKHSALFDSVRGYRCDERGQKYRLEKLDPGSVIQDYRIVSTACDEEEEEEDNNNHHHPKRIPIGNTFTSYFDCRDQTTVECPENHIFNGVQCVPKSSRTHNFKNVPIFQFDNLSPYNNWIKPWTRKPTKRGRLSCQGELRETTYIPYYDVCAHPDCAQYPFLMHSKEFSIILPRSRYMCIYRNGRIKKKKNPRQAPSKDFKLNFWAQRYVPYESSTDFNEKCQPGQKTSSGHFVFDSTMYTTCSEYQPFVFCPSSSTQGIQRIKNSYACVPKDDRRVYTTELPADTEAHFSVFEIHSIVPRPGARYRINDGPVTEYGRHNNNNGSPPPPPLQPLQITPRTVGKTLTFWSDQIATIYYETLMTYPVNVYIKNGQLVEDFRRGRGGFDVSIDQYVNHPMIVPKHKLVVV